MKDLSHDAEALLKAARAQRSPLDRRRREAVKQAVLVTVGATATGAAAAAELAGAAKPLASAWFSTAAGKVVVGLGAALVGSTATVGVVSAKRALSRPTSSTPALRSAAAPPPASGFSAAKASGTATDGVVEPGRVEVPAAKEPVSTPATTTEVIVEGLESSRAVKAAEPSAARTGAALPPARRSGSASTATVKAEGAGWPVATTGASSPPGSSGLAAPGVGGGVGQVTATGVPLPGPLGPATVAAPRPPGVGGGVGLVTATDVLLPSPPPGLLGPATVAAPRSPGREGPDARPVTSSAPGGPRAPSEAVGPLADELLVLRAALKHHEAARDEAALERLDEYQRRHQGGALQTEADTLRVLVLCRLGRKPEAAEVLRALRRSAPVSPAAQRLSSSCAAE
ncbi:MAG: hypothetical protein IAE78_28985 [Myxococcus sp.]|nr:hypothetical protein [Myxococcus sp.]